MAVLGGCGGSDATGPEVPLVDEQPTISGIAVKADGQVYLRAGLTASAADPEGKLSDVIVDWGDQKTTTLTSGFDDISRTHDYDEAGKYTVVVTATDAGGNRVTAQSSIEFEEVPQPCIDIKIVGACLKVHPNYKGADVELKFLDVKVTSFTISTTKNKLEFQTPMPVPSGKLIPPVWPAGRVIAEANFSKEKNKSYVRIRVLGCISLTKCEATVFDERLKW
jgi:hypothetical protein